MLDRTNAMDRAHVDADPTLKVQDPDRGASYERGEPGQEDSPRDAGGPVTVGNSCCHPADRHRAAGEKSQGHDTRRGTVKVLGKCHSHPNERAGSTAKRHAQHPDGSVSNDKRSRHDFRWARQGGWG
jgi:hypothetical protein